MKTTNEAACRSLRAARLGSVWLPLILGLILSTCATAATLTRTSAFDYDATSGLLTKEVIEPGDSKLCLVTEYTYDNYGNKQTSTTRNCNGSAGSVPESSEAPAPAAGDPALIVTRSSTVNYVATAANPTSGQFPTNASNALGQNETKTYDPRFGGVLSLTGPNGLSTQWQYDGFGRKTKEIRADGTQTKWDYRYCAGINGGSDTCPTINGVAGKYLVQTTPLDVNGTTANGPWAKTYYDSLGREIRTETQGNDINGTSANVYTDTWYDTLGRVARVSRPYASGQIAYWTINTYDALGRVVLETRPATNGATATTQTAYNGLSVTVTDALNHAKTTLKNDQGQIIQVTDALNNNITYQYDPFGNLTTTTDPHGNVTTLGYDLRGRKTSMTDPDMGHWQYDYDVLGQLVRQTDAKNKTSDMIYDKLGRMTQRAEHDLVSEWIFDNCYKGIGKLCQANADNGYQRTHSYDSLGRPSITVSTIDSGYAQSVTYDVHGRTATQTWWPTNVSVRYIYTALGYLKEVRNNQSNDLYWQANSRDAEGRLVTQTYGNNVMTQQVFDPGSGQLKNVYAGAGNGVLALTYQYDSLGNIQTRSDGNRSLNESFTYDALNRLKTAQVNSPGAGIVTSSYNYDALGNIIYRSDVGNYSYGGTNNKPHAVKSINGGPAGSNYYHYDANGNLLDSNNRFEVYTSFNMPSLLASAALDEHYLYGPEHQRVKMVSSASGTTIYLHPDNSGGLSFEKETDNNGIVEQRHYITAGGQVVAMLKIRNGVTSVRYFHRDNLGSTAAVTDKDGIVVERLAYEPFGKRRFPNGTADPNDTIHGQETERGYTNHEHLDELGLIHMNGRIYDPLLGRFMSADPTIQSPYDLQSYNRYSYVLNNPLIYTDPTGYKAFWKQKWFRSVASIAVAVFAPEVLFQNYWVAGMSQTAASVAAFTTTGALSGYIATGTLNGALNGAATAGMFYGIGTAFPGDVSPGLNTLGHAAVGCASASLSGGDCGNGALSASAGAAWTNYGYHSASFEANLISTTVVGGTASVLGGGKFGNGAQTAAFGYLFNECAHRDCFGTNPPFPGAVQTKDPITGKWIWVHRDYIGKVATYAAQPTVAANANVGAEGSIFAGVVGASFSVSPVTIDSNANACFSGQACLQLGLGGFIGGGGNAGVGVGSPLTSGRSDSFGLFYNVGSGGAGGGSLTVSGDGVGGARGFLGGGLGAAGGVQFCQSYNSCR